MKIAALFLELGQKWQSFLYKIVGESSLILRLALLNRI